MGVTMEIDEKSISTACIMIKAKEIIPDAVLEFMKNCAIEKINSSNRNKEVLINDIKTLYYSNKVPEIVLKMLKKRLKATKFSKSEYKKLEVKNVTKMMIDLEEKLSLQAKKEEKDFLSNL